MPGLPYDSKKGVIPNDSGRVLQEENGLYVAGWIKRGPSGVIGTNKPDAVESVQSLLSDLPALTPCEKPDTNALVALLQDRGVRVVSFTDWEVINAAELARGEAVGKPREKFSTVDEMLNLL